MDDTLKRFFQLPIILAGLQLLIGVGAVGGGLYLVIDPSGGAIGIPLDLLDGSPFPDYFVPGLFLLTINGLGSIAGSLATFRKTWYAGELAMVLGFILMAWIVIQLVIIESFSFLHPFYFVAGLVEGIGGYLLRKRIKNKLIA